MNRFQSNCKSSILNSVIGLSNALRQIYGAEVIRNARIETSTLLYPKQMQNKSNGAF